MPIRISIRADAGDTIGELRQLSNRLEQPPGAILAPLAPVLLNRMRESIRSQGRRLGASWPELRPATVAERKRKGFSEGPALIRSGRLLGSLRVSGLVFESDHPGARPLQERFPFWGFNDEDADLVARTIADQLLG